VGTWLIIARLLGYSSLAALVAAPAPFVTSLLLAEPLPIRIACGLLGLIVLARHHDNIRRLLTGTEGRVGDAQG